MVGCTIVIWFRYNQMYLVTIALKAYRTISGSCNHNWVLKLRIFVFCLVADNSAWTRSSPPNNQSNRCKVPWIYRSNTKPEWGLWQIEWFQGNYICLSHLFGHIFVAMACQFFWKKQSGTETEGKQSVFLFLQRSCVANEHNWSSRCPLQLCL